MISSVSFAELVDPKDVKEWNQYIVKHVFALFEKQSFVSEMTSQNISTLLHLPILCNRQVLTLDDREMRVNMTNDIISKMLGLFDNNGISRESEHQLETFRALI